MSAYPNKPTKEDEDITELMVCRSAAGYYIGTLFYDFEMQGWFPYSRDSQEYWANKEDAQRALEEDNYLIKNWP